MHDKSGRTSGRAAVGGSSNAGGVSETSGDGGSTAKRHGSSGSDSADDALTGGDPGSLIRGGLMSMLDRVPERYRAYQSEQKFKDVVEQWKPQMDGKDYESITAQA